MSAALNLLGALVLEDGRRWGDAAVGFQRADAAAVLDEGSKTPYHYLTRSRGGSKTSDLAGVAIAAMLTQLTPGSRCYALAADRDQGRLLLDSVLGFQARTPELRSGLRVDAYRVTATRRDTTLDVLAADAPGAWGLRPAFLVVDELAMWATTPATRVLWEAATTAAAKMPGCRLVVLTTAGDPAHWSYGVLEHARADPLWRTHEVPGPAPWADPERLAEQRRRLPASSYLRLFENVWTAAEDRLVDPDDLAACVVLDGPLAPEPGRRYVVGVDIGIVHDRSVVAVCHSLDQAIPDGPVRRRVVLDRMHVFQGSKAAPVALSDVEAAVYDASITYHKARVVYDPFQAVGSAQRLASRGIKVEPFTFSSSSVGRLASVLHLLLRDRLLSLPDDPELLDELANVRLRETSPGVLRIDHDAGKHDDRVIALALCAHALLSPTGGGAAWQVCWRCAVWHETTGPNATPCSGGEFVYKTGGLTLVGDRFRDRLPGEGWGR